MVTPPMDWVMAMVAMTSVPFQARIIRKRPELHKRFFVFGARYGRLYFPLCAVLIVTGLTTLFETNRWANEGQWNFGLWRMVTGTVAYVLVGALRPYPRGNSLLAWEWRRADTASLHIRVSTLTPEHIRRFLSAAPDLWDDARRLGFRRVTMLSPLLVDEGRRHRVVEHILDRAKQEGVECEVELIGPGTWYWLRSLIYFLQHSRKSRCPSQLEKPLFNRLFRVPVAGVALVVVDASPVDV